MTAFDSLAQQAGSRGVHPSGAADLRSEAPVHVTAHDNRALLTGQ
jgi:hypothetical protein